MTNLNLSRSSKPQEPYQNDGQRGTEMGKAEGERREGSKESPWHLHPCLNSPDGMVMYLQIYG